MIKKHLRHSLFKKARTSTSEPIVETGSTKNTSLTKHCTSLTAAPAFQMDAAPGRDTESLLSHPATKPPPPFHSHQRMLQNDRAMLPLLTKINYIHWKIFQYFIPFPFAAYYFLFFFLFFFTIFFGRQPTQCHGMFHATVSSWDVATSSFAEKHKHKSAEQLKKTS